jgi:hypothetical protein
MLLQYINNPPEVFEYAPKENRIVMDLLQPKTSKKILQTG